MKKWFSIFITLAFVIMLAAPVYAAEDFPPPRNNAGTIGNPRTGAAWQLIMGNKVEMEEISAPSGNPASNHGWIYVKDKTGTSALYFEDDAGGVVQLGTGATPSLDTVTNPAADVTWTFDDNETQVITYADTNEDMLNIQGLGAFGDVSVVRIEQKTGNPTDGTVLEVVAADANVDPLVVSASGKANALVVGQNTGVVTIAGVAEGTTALSITKGDIDIVDGDLILTAGDATFNEDVTIVGNLIGGTGLINYTNFDVDAAGNLTAVDGTFSGNVSVTGTFKQDALAPASAAPTTITVDGAGAGGVTVGGTSTGAITLGGGATSVVLPAATDLTLQGGVIAITDNANADVLTITNATVTSQSAIQIDTNAISTGKVIQATADGLTSGVMLYLDSDGADTDLAAGGLYIQAYDGAATDFSVGRYGGTTIAGNASTDVLTITAGDVQITAGDIDMDLGIISIDNTADEGNRIARNNATGTAAVLEIEQTHTGGGIALLVDQNNTTAAEYAIDITSDGATQIHFTANGAAGDGMLYDVTNSWTGQAFKIDAGPWLGTLGEGAALDFRSDSAATAEAGQAILIKFQGTGADAAGIDGKGLYIEDEAAATAGSYLVKLDTLANTALHISNAGTAADGIKFDVANSYTGQGIVADLGPWLGTGGEGFISLTSDNAATVPAGQFMRFRQLGTGQHAAAIGGTLIYLEDDATAPAAGTSYAMLIDATNIEAIHVDTGKVLVDETVTATAGLSSGTAADSYIYTDTVELSNADIKALRASPKTLVAAKGANNIIEFVSAVLILDYGSEVLTETVDNMVIEYEDGQDVTAAIEATGFIDAAADQVAFIIPAGVATMTAATASNKAIRLFNTGDGEYGGNASNDTTMTVKVSYRVHANGL